MSENLPTINGFRLGQSYAEVLTQLGEAKDSRYLGDDNRTDYRHEKDISFLVDSSDLVVEIRGGQILEVEGQGKVATGMDYLSVIDILGEPNDSTQSFSYSGFDPEFEDLSDSPVLIDLRYDFPSCDCRVAFAHRPSVSGFWLRRPSH